MELIEGEVVSARKRTILEAFVLWKRARGERCYSINRHSNHLLPPMSFTASFAYLT